MHAICSGDYVGGKFQVVMNQGWIHHKKHRQTFSKFWWIESRLIHQTNFRGFSLQSFDESRLDSSQKHLCFFFKFWWMGDSSKNIRDLFPSNLMNRWFTKHHQTTSVDFFKFWWIDARFNASRKRTGICCHVLKPPAIDQKRVDPTPPAVSCFWWVPWCTVSQLHSLKQDVHYDLIAIPENSKRCTQPTCNAVPGWTHYHCVERSFHIDLEVSVCNCDSGELKHCTQPACNTVAGWMPSCVVIWMPGAFTLAWRFRLRCQSEEFTKLGIRIHSAVSAWSQTRTIRLQKPTD